MRAGLTWQAGGFAQYLRTGRVTIRQPLEVKFNPYHDADDGRFTFRPGGGTLIPRGAARVSEWTQNSGQERRSARKPVSIPLYQTRMHHELDVLGASHPADKGTAEWTPARFAKWVVGGDDIHAFKRNWVHGHRHAIRAAADRFDLPRTLVAGVAYTEVGGDPEEIDPVAYALRSGSDRDRTSIGPLGVQFRRAAESLGYGPVERITASQRRAIYSSLLHADTNIAIAAKHLADLRDRDFRGTHGYQLTRDQIEIIASRYNRGPEISIDEVRRNLSYGRSITKRWKINKEAAGG
jgi:hypothetical protein